MLHVNNNDVQCTFGNILLLLRWHNSAALACHMCTYYSRLVPGHDIQHLRPEDVACYADTADPCAIDLVCSSANICNVPVIDGDYCAASGKANNARQI